MQEVQPEKPESILVSKDAKLALLSAGLGAMVGALLTVFSAFIAPGLQLNAEREARRQAAVVVLREHARREIAQTVSNLWYLYSVLPQFKTDAPPRVYFDEFAPAGTSVLEGVLVDLPVECLPYAAKSIDEGRKLAALGAATNAKLEALHAGMPGASFDPQSLEARELYNHLSNYWNETARYVALHYEGLMEGHLAPFTYVDGKTRSHADMMKYWIDVAEHRAKLSSEPQSLRSLAPKRFVDDAQIHSIAD